MDRNGTWGFETTHKSGRLVLGVGLKAERRGFRHFQSGIGVVCPEALATPSRRDSGPSVRVDMIGRRRAVLFSSWAARAPQPSW